MNLEQELRYRLTKQILTKAEYRKKVLKIERFYFNQNIDGVESFYKIPLSAQGMPIPFANMKGKTLRKILDVIEKGDIYGWIEYKGSRCKIRPKKIDRK